MPLNIHENEHLQTYAKNVTFVSQDSFELSCLDTSANGIIHADQGVRISANKAEFVITGAGKIGGLTDIKPYILASVPDEGSIILDASSGNATQFCIFTLSDKQIQAIGGNGGTPTSMLIKDGLFEVVAGNGLTPASHSKASVKPLSVTLQSGAACSLEMKPLEMELKAPTSISLECGPLASIQIKPDSIVLKVGATELSLSAIEAKMKSLESEIMINAERIRRKAINLEDKADLLAKKFATLQQETSQAIAEIKAALQKKN